MTDLDQYPLRDTAIYNPHLLSKDELISLFAARRQLLNQLLEDLSRCPADKTPQHHLLVAQRGMGKTMLLRRLQFAIEDDRELAADWLPLTFPEEQYNVGGLSDLWLNCIDALADALSRHGYGAEAERLDSELEKFLNLEEESLTAETLNLLIQTAARLKKRLVLLIDNIDLILERISDQAWTLREVLSEESGLLLIGASARALESSYKYDKPFYDFFQIHELGGLSFDETEDLLRHYSERWQNAEVMRVLAEEPARIRTLHTLTGGNPRTITLLYNILGRGLGGDVRTDLENLLDQCTPLYKARLEALAPQRQRVVHALAVHWDPTTAAQVAGDLRLDVKAVSSQLTRLVRDGAVEAVAFDPATKSGFQLAERFFNIWYLMRATRQVRRKLIWLVRFLKMFYSQSQLRRHALNLMRNKTNGGPMRRAEDSFVMASAVEDVALKHSLEMAGLCSLIGDEQSRWKLNELVDLDGADAHLRTRAEHLERLEDLHSRVLALRLSSSQWTATDLWKRLAGAPVPLTTKEELIGRLEGGTPEQFAEVKTRLGHRCRAVEEYVNCDAATADLFRAFREGYMLAVDDVEGARAAGAALNLPSVVPLAVAFKALSEPRPERLKELLASLDSSPSPMPALIWLHHAGEHAIKGDVRRVIEQVLDLQETNLRTLTVLAETALQIGRPKEAETALRRVVGQQPTDATAWYNLGKSISEQDRGTEAEYAYRKALQEDPDLAVAWYSLGTIVGQQGLGEEAEEAFRNALRIDPQFAKAWTNLGNVLSQQDRDEEAEDAFRKALEIDPESAVAWSNLGNAYHSKGRLKEAERAWQESLRIDPKYSLASFNLANGLVRQGRFTEAEEAFRKTLELDPLDGVAWARLGYVVYQLGHAEEAEDAYRKAIGLAPKDPAPLSSLAWLLYEQRRSITEARKLAAAAVDLDEEDLHFAHTYATILVANGEWSMAEVHARRFLAGPADFLAQIWSDIIVFFREAVTQGYAREAGALLEASALAGHWRPLCEALELIAIGRRSYLKRLAPEIRQPTEEILEQLGWKEPTAKPSPKRATAASRRRT